MKKLISVLAILLSFNSFADNIIAEFANDQGCSVYVGQTPQQIVISASKSSEEDQSSAQVWIYKDFHTAWIPSYCNEWNVHNARVQESDENIQVDCYNEKASITTDMDIEYNMSYFKFEGYHKYFLWKVDDSFECENLKRVQ